MAKKKPVKPVDRSGCFVTDDPARISSKPFPTIDEMIDQAKADTTSKTEEAHKHPEGKAR